MDYEQQNIESNTAAPQHQAPMSQFQTAQTPGPAPKVPNRKGIVILIVLIACGLLLSGLVFIFLAKGVNDLANEATYSDAIERTRRSHANSLYADIFNYAAKNNTYPTIEALNSGSLSDEIRIPIQLEKEIPYIITEGTPGDQSMQFVIDHACTDNGELLSGITGSLAVRIKLSSSFYCVGD